MVTVPVSGRAMPPIRLRKVLLPLPECPTMETNSPCWMRKIIGWTALMLFPDIV